MERGTYIKTGTTIILTYFNLDLILIEYIRKIREKKRIGTGTGIGRGMETVYRNMKRKSCNKKSQRNNKRNKKTLLKCEPNEKFLI